MFQENICACCGKRIIRGSFYNYTYTIGQDFFCGWNCYRKGKRVAPPVDNTCVCCGAEIPEGRQVCKECEKLARKKKGKNI